MPCIEKVIAVFFSPTGNTAKIIKTIAQKLASKLAVPSAEDDFTLPKQHEAVREFGAHDLVVFGVPTYAGRVPNKVLPFVQNLFCGNGARAAAVVTFGNRSFDNSLRELGSELLKNGFSVLGAAAVVCEHAFAAVGLGRPNEEDMAALNTFCESLVRKITLPRDGISDFAIKGNDALEGYYVPLGTDGKPVNFLKAKPITDKTKCDNCGVCAAVCPMAAIDKNDVSLVPGICIKCQACIVYCHTKAKSFDDPLFISHRTMLEKNYTRPAVSEFFL